MELEKIIHYSIYIHAALGGIALIAGMISLVAQKGGNNHKLAGKIFYYSLLTSIIISFFIAVAPNHENAFLFSIGIFSLYLITMGYRALQYKKGTVVASLDKIISGVMLIVGLLMIILPLIIYQKINIVLAVFGLIGSILAFLDLRSYKNPEELKKKWLTFHLTKMIGGYIATTTAFIVVNQWLPGIVGWLAPTVIGSIYIAYWIRKMRISQR